MENATGQRLAILKYAVIGALHMVEEWKKELAEFEKATPKRKYRLTVARKIQLHRASAGRWSR